MPPSQRCKHRLSGSGPSLEVADIFRDHGAAWRAANAGHISLNQFKVMSAIERCRTAALGGHVARCADCAHEHVAYNSCRNRHCPKCQSGAAKTWLAAREAELLPVRYFHLVFTLPRPIADIAHQNKREIYNLLMRVSADTVIKIAADPKHLGAKVGITSVLHTWGSAMTHHPHVHMIVPGGGLSPDGTRLLSASIDETLRLWDLKTMAEIKAFKENDEQIYAAAFSPDGESALSAGRYGYLVQWDLSTGQSLRTIRAHEAIIWAVAFFPDGRFALTAGSDDLVRV